MHFVNAKTILSSHNGMNIYRGCTHGCIYCDSRSNCYHIEHAFEDIEVKQNAAELLEHSLIHKRKKCMIGTGSMSDPYMTCEKDLQLMRRCLEIIEHHGFGATVLTKSDLVLRDLDLLKKINQKARAVLQMTLTTFDEVLCKKIEPGVCTTKRRVEVLEKFHNEGIETCVWLDPFLPFINDNRKNIEGLLTYLDRCKVNAIIYFGAGLTLREGNREYFYSALDKKFPGIKQRYIQTYANSYKVTSRYNAEITKMIKDFCVERKIIFGIKEPFEWLNNFPDKNNIQAEFEF